MYDELPHWLRTAVETVLRDLQQPVPLDLRVSYEEQPDGLATLWVAERAPSGTTGVTVWPDMEPAELGGEPWWTCPASRRRIARIGTLTLQP